MTCSSMTEGSVRGPEVVVVDSVAEVQGFHAADKPSPVIVDLRIDPNEAGNNSTRQGCLCSQRASGMEHVVFNVSSEVDLILRKSVNGGSVSVDDGILGQGYWASGKFPGERDCSYRAVSGSKRRRSLPEFPLSRDSDSLPDENERAELQQQACKVLLRELGNRVAFSDDGLSLEEVTELLDGAPSKYSFRGISDDEGCEKVSSEDFRVEKSEEEEDNEDEEEEEEAEAAIPRECGNSDHVSVQEDGESPSKKARRPSLSVMGGAVVADSATTPRLLAGASLAASLLSHLRRTAGLSGRVGVAGSRQLAGQAASRSRPFGITVHLGKLSDPPSLLCTLGKMVRCQQAGVSGSAKVLEANTSDDDEELLPCSGRSCWACAFPSVVCSCGSGTGGKRAEKGEVGREASVGKVGEGSKEQSGATSSVAEGDGIADCSEDKQRAAANEQEASACGKDPMPAVVGKHSAASVSGKRTLEEGGKDVCAPVGGDVLIASAQQRKKHHHHHHHHANDQHKEHQQQYHGKQQQQQQQHVVVQEQHKEHNHHPNEQHVERHHGTDKQQTDKHALESKPAQGRQQELAVGAVQTPASEEPARTTSLVVNTDEVRVGAMTQSNSTSTVEADAGEYSESHDGGLVGKSLPVLAPCDSAKCDSMGSMSKTVEERDTGAVIVSETTLAGKEASEKLPGLVHGEEGESEQDVCDDDVADFEEMLANDLTPGLEDKVAGVIADSVAEAVDVVVGSSMAGVGASGGSADVDAEDGCFLPDLTPPDMDPADLISFPSEIEASNELQCEEEREILQGQEEGEEEGEEEDEEEAEGEGVDDELEALYFIKRLPDVSLYRPHACRPLLPQKKAGTPPVTLVLDLDETLVHSVMEQCDVFDFSFPVLFNYQTHTVFVRKRPFLATFLERVSKLFEVVIFTASQSVYAEQLLDIIDPKRECIHHRLFRDSCIYVEGNYVKDLSSLGRDMTKTVIVDNSPQAFAFQVDNGIPIEAWFDDPNDIELKTMLSFLEGLAAADDVRPLVVSKFNLRHKINCLPDIYMQEHQA